MDYKRLETARLSDKGKDCISTALFLVGDRDTEMINGKGHEIISTLKKLKPIQEPQIEVIVAWESTSSIYSGVSHVGVVISVNPLLITHRDGPHGPLCENQPFEKVDAKYARPDLSVNYYLPNS